MSYSIGSFNIRKKNRDERLESERDFFEFIYDFVVKLERRGYEAYFKNIAVVSEMGRGLRAYRKWKSRRIWFRLPLEFKSSFRMFKR